MRKLKLKIPFTNRVLELRASTLSNPSKWAIDWFGGFQSKSGANVNEETALRVTAYLAAVKVISETVASLPLLTYQKLKEGGKARAPNHPMFTILHDIGNEEMTAYTMRETIQGHACNWGNGYAEIERDFNGNLIGLWPLLPDRTFPERNPTTKKIQYRTIIDNQQFVLPFEKVLHIPGFGFDGLVGYNPVLHAREAIGISLATEEFGARFFGDGANPSGIIEYPGKMKELAVQEFKKDAKANYGGLGNSHRLMVLEEGLKFHQTTIPPEVAQFLETRKFQIAEIARVFRVPLHMLAELDRSTNNNIEHQGIEFVTHTIRPWLVRWEQAIHMRLLTPAERRKGFFAEHLVDALLRGDTESRYNAYAVARQNGWYSVNDIRSKENENPVPGGDAYTMNGNMIPIDQAGTVPINKPGGGGGKTNDKKVLEP